MIIRACLLMAGVWVGGASPLSAQIVSSVSVQNEDRFRGRPVSAARPIVRVDVSRDTAGGFYFGASITAVARGGVQLLAAQQYAGYAHRLRSGTVIEGGIVNRYYGPAFSGDFETDFVEAYAGVTSGGWTGRIYVSPSYYGTGRVTVYVEVDKAARLSEHVTLDAHAGILVPLTEVPNPRFVRGQYDVRIGVTRAFKRIDLRAGYAWAGPRSDNFGGRARGRGAVIIGASYGF